MSWLEDICVLAREHLCLGWRAYVSWLLLQTCAILGSDFSGELLFYMRGLNQHVGTSLIVDFVSVSIATWFPHVGFGELSASHPPSSTGLTTLGAFKSYSWVPSRPTKKGMATP